MRRRLAYEPGLDGLRALAVVAVLAFHDGRLAGGFLGVSTFFTLSGFLITSLLLAEHAATGRVSLREFYARRIRRLLPAALLGVALAGIVAIVVHDATTARTFRGDALGALANVANWRFLWSGRSYAQLFATPSPLLHFWSLAIEEQLYLVLAPVLALVLACSRGRRAVVAVVLGALAAASLVAGWMLADGAHGIDRAYYGTDTRALEFLVGALLATAVARRALPRLAARAVSIAGPLAIVVLAVAATRARVGQRALFHGGLLAYALGGAVVILAAREAGPVRAVLSNAPLRALGRISYGLYVFHWPIFLWLTHARTGLGRDALTIVRVAVTLAAATASFVLVERPVRRGERVVGGARVAVPAAAYAGAIALAIAVAATAPAPVIEFAPTTSPAAMLAALQAAERTTTTVRIPMTLPRTGPVPSSTRASSTTGTTPSSSAPATTAVTPTSAATTTAAPHLDRVLVVGDSVALTLGRGIERWGRQHNVFVWNGGALGCSLLDGALVRGYWGVDARPPDACHTLRNEPAVLDTFRPDVVVVLYGAWDVYDASFDGGHSWASPGQPAWNQHYAADVQQMATMLRSRGARIVWLAPPCFTTRPDAPDYHAAWYDPARVDALGAIDRQVASTTPGMTVTDVIHQMGCPVDLADRPDGAHYSDPGADRAAARLDPVLTAALPR